MTWRPARCLTVLHSQFNAYAPNRSRVSDGMVGNTAHAARFSYHNPDANGIVRAADWTHDPANGMDIDRITDELVASGDRRIHEIIANGLYWHHANRRWVPYTGPNPHRRHFHLTCVAASAGGDDATLWALPMFVGGGSAPQAPVALPSAPPFPLPAGYYFGPLTGPKQSISCQHRTDRPAWREGLRLWQRRMIDRGWGGHFRRYGADGLYGRTVAESEAGSCALAFQAEKGLHRDGLIGPQTWAAAWTAPVT